MFWQAHVPFSLMSSVLLSFLTFYRFNNGCPLGVLSGKNPSVDLLSSCIVPVSLAHGL